MIAFSIFYWGFFCLSLPFFFVGLVAVRLLTVALDRRGVIAHRYTSLWGLFYIWANPLWTLEVKGRESVPRRGPAVIVANHSSHLDILVLFGLLRTFKWVSKIENFKLPIIGWTMKINGYPGVKRGDRASVVEMMQACGEWLKAGVPVLIFPEGTRSMDGKMRYFKDGAFQLAIEHGCPIIPVAVHGTADVLPKNGFILGPRMRARVEVLEPLSPEHFETVEALREATKAALAGALEGAA